MPHPAGPTKRRRRAAIATLLRGCSEAARLDDNVGKVEVFLGLPRRLAQSAHAAGHLAWTGRGANMA